MITFDRVGVRFADADRPVLWDVDLTVPEGELALVVGRTGSGKSTLLRAVNGLVPHFTGGTLSGRVLVDGRDTRDHRPRDLADVVGYVGQDPLAGFVADTVEDELAYGMESLGLPADVMRKRVEETLDLLGLAELRNRPLAALSGGQQQRVAIGSVLTTHPRVLVLDEPTSALDPLAAEEVLAALQRLVHDLGLTVLLAEHRLERVVQYADRVVLVPGDGRPVVVGHAGGRPGHRAGRPARGRAGPDRGLEPAPALGAGRATTGRPVARDAGRRGDAGPRARRAGTRRRRGRAPGRVATARSPPCGASSTALRRRRGGGPDGPQRRRQVHPAQSPRRHEEARRRPCRGGRPGAHRPRPGELLHHVGLVPQVPGDLLYSATVDEECVQADKDCGAADGTTLALFARLSPGVPVERHPRDLSEGQRLALSLAIVLAAEPPLVLLDEPTRGLDYTAKHRLVEILRDLAAAGHAVLLATHDVELVAEVAHRVLVIADGEIVADGPTADVVVSSPAFAPQVAKVLAPQPWLTATEVAVALASSTRIPR